MPNTFWQSTTTWYCFAFDRLLLTLATSVVSLTATIWHYQGIEMCKWYAACKKKKIPKSLLEAKRNSVPALELSSPHSWGRILLLTGLESGGRDWLQVRAEAASPQQGSGLAETSAAGVTAGTYDRGGKAGAFRATPMRNLAVLPLNKIWNRYSGQTFGYRKIINKVSQQEKPQWNQHCNKTGMQAFTKMQDF